MSDGQQDEIVLLNEDGCSQDKFLLGNVEYAGDLWARKESHVFKYADRANLYFDCQMRVTIKEPGQDCPVSHPVFATNKNTTLTFRETSHSTMQVP